MNASMCAPTLCLREFVVYMYSYGNKLTDPISCDQKRITYVSKW